MKIESQKAIKGVKEVESVQSGADRPTVKQAAADRVTVGEGRDVAKLVDAAKARVSMSRAARLQELEAAVNSGTFRPDARQLAEHLLASAELDAKLRAMIKR